MWVNGMMHSNNPLAKAGLEVLTDENDDLEMYGYDVQGPSSTDGDNNVTVEPVDLTHGDIIKSYVLEILDPLRPSTEMGIDIYLEALDRVLFKINEL